MTHESRHRAQLFQYFEQFLTNDVFSVLMHEAAAAISNADLDAAFVPSFQADVNRYIRLVTWFVRFDYVRQIQVSLGPAKTTLPIA
jgi:hypothetical protein